MSLKDEVKLHKRTAGVGDSDIHSMSLFVIYIDDGVENVYAFLKVNSCDKKLVRSSQPLFRLKPECVLADAMDHMLKVAQGEISLGQARFMCHVIRSVSGISDSLIARGTDYLVKKQNLTASLRKDKIREEASLLIYAELPGDRR
ncbi:hypothetical protein T265_10668 [Opisthorchis viverrini]|uniref:Uncharacterized protein n=1 Tax=Opisthorchis viverrini TaxID=6198 RepID=A0A075A0A9_OPIVI|nr:hypothetical protein T265_10668 [Opisthorchis viverrini]KER20859.1 hypothetical protein T265_10668 [Opisthorchis viverrini]